RKLLLPGLRGRHGLHLFEGQARFLPRRPESHEGTGPLRGATLGRSSAQGRTQWRTRFPRHARSDRRTRLQWVVRPDQVTLFFSRAQAPGLLGSGDASHSINLWTALGICPIFRIVANATRNAAQNNPINTEVLPFEEALKRLEAIVDAMESEDLPLETLLGKYQEGTRLARICKDKLAEAELK